MTPEFLQNTESRKELGKAFATAGLLTIVILGSTDPLVSGALVLTGSVGAGMAQGLLERTYDKMFRNQALDNPIGWALGESFKGANADMKNFWQQSYYYPNLERNYPTVAYETLEVFSMLHEDVPKELLVVDRTSLGMDLTNMGTIRPTFFSNALASTRTNLTNIGTNQSEIQSNAGLLIANKFKQYSNLYIPVFKDFMVGNSETFVKLWTLHLQRTLQKEGRENNIAWRAFQILWNQATLETALSLRHSQSFGDLGIPVKKTESNTAKTKPTRTQGKLTQSFQDTQLSQLKQIIRSQRKLARRLEQLPEEEREKTGEDALRNLSDRMASELSFLYNPTLPNPLVQKPESEP